MKKLLIYLAGTAVLCTVLTIGYFGFNIHVPTPQFVVSMLSVYGALETRSYLEQKFK